MLWLKELRTLNFNVEFFERMKTINVRLYCRVALLAVTAMVFSTLAGCDDNDGISSSSAVDTASTAATVSLGPVTDAAVVAFRADHLAPDKPLSEQKSSILDTVLTDSHGVASGLQISSYSGPVLYAVLVDKNTSYYDEASGTIVRIPSITYYPSGLWFQSDAFFPGSGYTPSVLGHSDDHSDARVLMFALTPGPRERVAVTPLTTLAFLATFHVNGGLFPLTAEDADRVNNAIRNALAPNVNSILEPPTPFDSQVTTGSLDDNSADTYALLLAGLAQLADSNAAPGLAALVHLVGDLQNDGKLDADYNPGRSRASYSNFSKQWKAALVELAQLYGTNALQNAISKSHVDATPEFISSGDQDSSSSDGGNVPQPGTITAFINGTKYTFNQVGVHVINGFVFVSAVLPNHELVSLNVEFKIDGSSPVHCVRNSNGGLDGHITLNGLPQRAKGGRITAPVYGIYVAGPILDGSSCTFNTATSGASTVGTFSATLIKGANALKITEGAYNIIMPGQGGSFGDRNRMPF